MPSLENQFARLVRLSRRAPDAAPADALPAALATRVLDRIRVDNRVAESAWEWLSPRALPVAAALAAVCVYLGDDVWPVRPDDELRLAQAMMQEQLTP